MWLVFPLCKRKPCFFVSTRVANTSFIAEDHNNNFFSLNASRFISGIALSPSIPLLFLSPFSSPLVFFFFTPLFRPCSYLYSLFFFSGPARTRGFFRTPTFFLVFRIHASSMASGLDASSPYPTSVALGQRTFVRSRSPEAWISGSSRTEEIYYRVGILIYVFFYFRQLPKKRAQPATTWSFLYYDGFLSLTPTPDHRRGIFRGQDKETDHRRGILGGAKKKRTHERSM